MALSAEWVKMDARWAGRLVAVGDRLHFRLKLSDCRQDGGLSNRITNRFFQARLHTIADSSQTDSQSLTDYIRLATLGKPDALFDLRIESVADFYLVQRLHSSDFNVSRECQCLV